MCTEFSLFIIVAPFHFSGSVSLQVSPRAEYCDGDGKVSFTRPFLMLGKVTFDAHVNVLERYCKGDISDTFTKP